MAKVSVILPSLNVVNFIKETMDSVVNQTLSDIEIICVDAGSTDGTVEVLKEYASRDPRIKLLHSDKRSYGYQMNLGIREATGEYIGIVETDDFVAPNMYEELYRVAKLQSADVVKSDFDMFTTLADGRQIFLTHHLGMFERVSYDTTYSAQDYIEGNFGVECYIWNAIYKRDFLLNNHIWFHESPGAAFQDFGFKYQTAFAAERIVAVKQSFYRYRRDNAGSSTYNKRTVEFNLAEAKFLLKALEERQIKDRKVYEAAARAIIQYAAWPYLELIKWQGEVDNIEELLGEYRELFVKFFENDLVDEKKIHPGLWSDAHKIVENIPEFVAYAKELTSADAKRIREFLEVIRAHEHVVIFGKCYRGDAIATFLLCNGCTNLFAFCENKAEKHGVEEHGIEVVSPEKAVEKYPNALYLLSSLRAVDAMTKQLQDLGVSQEDILVYPFECSPAFCMNAMVKGSF